MSIRSKISQDESITEIRRALQHFTNRKNSIRHFASYLNDDPAREQILFFHGDGGNGKTILLRFLKERCCNRLATENWEYVKSLEGDDFIENFADAYGCVEMPSSLIDFAMEPRGEYRPKEPFSALLKMRRDLSGGGLRFPLYDFACTLYLHKTGRLSQERLRELFPQEAMDFVVESINLIKEVTGAGLAKAVFGLFNKGLRDKFTLYLSARKVDEERVREMQSMDPEGDLYPLFPTLFAEDLNASMTLAGAPQRVALFFDTHEAFWEVSERKFSDEQYFLRDEWLRRLLCTLKLSKGIVAVVAGREEPRWAEATRKTIPVQHIDACLVEGLSPADAASYLEKTGIDGREMKESLITYAQVKSGDVHPLYLGLCADIVLAAKNRGKEIKAEEFQDIPEVALKGKELMDRLRKYVDKPTEFAITALSACRSFNKDLYISLMKGIDRYDPRESFDYLTEFSFVWNLEERGQGWYRIHDLMRRLAYEQNDQTILEAHRFLVQYYRARGEEGDITAIAERVYHASRLDSADGVRQWLSEMEQALSLSRYDVCRVFLGIHNELFLSDDFDRGLVSVQEGHYYASLSSYDDALTQFQEAIAAYNEALRRAPDYVTVHNNKGVALQSLGDLQADLSKQEEATRSYTQSIAAFDEALRRAPDYVGAHCNKGNALRSLGELQAGLSQHEDATRSYTRSIAAFDEALRRAPDDVKVYNNKGLALQSLGNLQADLSKYEEATRSYTRSIAAYDEVLRRAPDYVKAYNNKGYALRSLGLLQADLSKHEEATMSYT